MTPTPATETVIGLVRLMGTGCVPWSTPRTIALPDGRHFHKKNPRLCAWQDAIRAQVSRLALREPYAGPVRLVATFYRATTDERLHGRPWYDHRRGRSTGGDLTNLLKAAEDALTTWTCHRTQRCPFDLVYPGLLGNDNQVVAVEARKMFGPDDGVELRVVAAGV